MKAIIFCGFHKSGKTTLLTRTISDVNAEIRIGVVEGDIQTDIDAERIRATNAPAIQINTEGACHLSATQVHTALQQLPLDNLDVVFIENVGNLVCPSAFELGEDGKIVVLSVAEGDDKPAKYPGTFARATWCNSKPSSTMAPGQERILLLPWGWYRQGSGGWAHWC